MFVHERLEGRKNRVTNADSSVNSFKMPRKSSTLELHVVLMEVCTSYSTCLSLIFFLGGRRGLSWSYHYVPVLKFSPQWLTPSTTLSASLMTRYKKHSSTENVKHVMTQVEKQINIILYKLPAAWLQPT